MKNFLVKTGSIAMSVLIIFAACKKQETEIFATGGTAPVLTSSVSSTDTLTLLQQDSSSTAVIFTWTNPNYQFSDGISSQNVTYFLELDTAGDNFQNKAAPTISISISLSTSFTQQQLNNIAFNQLGLNPGTAHTIQARIESSITPLSSGSPQALPLYSNIVSVSLVPYKVVRVYPIMWVPGDYQGWTPNTAPSVAYGTSYSAADATQFEGYINVPSGGSYQFKFSQPEATNWSGINFGDGGGDVTNGTGGGGNLSTSGGAGNLQLPGGGYYRLNADTVALTWTYDAVTWGVIGTFNGWATDVLMTYDATRQLWWAVVPFDAAGSFKFRANADWSNPLHNFGVDGSGNLSYGSSTNIPGPAAAGSDSVFLDLHVAGNYTYTIQ